MDIERMQKINDLARTLVDRGIANSMDEATKQAEIMINKDDPGISSVFGTERRPMASQPMQAPAEQEEEVRIQLRKLKLQVSDQAKIIAELKNQMNSLINEINRMKIAGPRPAIIQREPGKEQTHLSKEATEKKPHAKVGNYTPDEITIEKFFYSGPPK